MALSGLTGYVTVDGVQLTFKDWSHSKKRAIIDRSHFATGGEPNNAKGQGTGTLELNAPLETAMGLIDGNLYTFVCGVTDALFLTVTARISDITISNKHDDGPMYKVTAEQQGAITLI